MICYGNIAEQAIKADPQDFSSVVKVDNHLHLDASYTSVHLLQFIKDKALRHGDDVVGYHCNDYQIACMH